MYTIYAYENGKHAIGYHASRDAYMSDAECLTRAGFEVYGNVE